MAQDPLSVTATPVFWPIFRGSSGYVVAVFFVHFLWQRSIFPFLFRL